MGEAACLALMGQMLPTSFQPSTEAYNPPLCLERQRFPQLIVSSNRGQDPGLLFTSPASLSFHSCACLAQEEGDSCSIPLMEQQRVPTQQLTVTVSFPFPRSSSRCGYS